MNLIQILINFKLLTIAKGTTLANLLNINETRYNIISKDIKDITKDVLIDSNNNSITIILKDNIELSTILPITL